MLDRHRMRVIDVGAPRFRSGLWHGQLVRLVALEWGSPLDVRVRHALLVCHLSDTSQSDGGNQRILRRATKRRPWLLLRTLSGRTVV